jgi:menaquinol-cytochrome c reductase iron-sulfur subunit
MSTELKESQRFQTPKERRDFLGLAALWSAGVAIATGLFGALRLPVPAVFPESSGRVKLGPRAKFANNAMVAFPEYRLWVFSDDRGLYAISAICTHLGCTVAAQETGGFYCPCHGSRFASSGAVIAGPAPRPLVYLALSVAPDGQIVVDQQQEVTPETRLTT